jgi:class 3 adenylate cyclase
MAKIRPSLRLVIGLLCAGVVLVVAAITLAITYSVSLSTVRDIGKKHSLSLAITARVQVQAYFDMPTQHLDTLAGVFKQDDMFMPSDDPLQGQPGRQDRLFYMLYTASGSNDFNYSAIGYIFEDASGAVMLAEGTEVIRWISRFRWQWPQGNMLLETRDIGRYNRSSLPKAQGLGVNSDARFAAYSTAKLLAGNDRRGMWYPILVYIIATNVYFQLPAAKPIYNATGQFIGFATLGQPLERISDFLKNVKGTPNTEMFAVVTSDGFMLGSTHKTPFITLTSSKTPPSVVAAGCSTSDSTSYGGGPTWIGCRMRATAFSAYPPLQAAAADAAFLKTTTPMVKDIKVGGNTYFVVSVPVPNAYRFWGMTVILCMPESDIIGDIISGRNMAIGITAGVCVAAALFAFGLVYAMLQPLTDISQRMLDTARLRETEDQKSYSALAEIQDLQKAYTNMNTAIKSFTRYVPRDVVKDLMASGQLCTIQMTPQRCTMLFVDIAGFTTICERVPPDVLSALVSHYFDRASRIVMEHDGLIDKFIGDCIMAVWGAPFGVANQEVKATLTGKLLDRETMVNPLAQQWDDAGEILRVRVGISTGEVLAGNMGSADRMSYTVIGDSVNLAARLESMNKQLGTRVMVSEMTAEGLGGIFVLRLLLPIAVVGKDKPVKVYEVMGLARQFDFLDTERLQKIDEASGNLVDLSESASDMGSVKSAKTDGERTSLTPSSQPSAHYRTRRSKTTTVSMLRDATVKTASDHPIIATVDEGTYAMQYSNAVIAYMRRDFAAALTLLAGITKNAMIAATASDSYMTAVASSKSFQMLYDLCEKYLKDGCPSDFDGVFRALEK